MSMMPGKPSGCGGLSSCTMKSPDKVFDNVNLGRFYSKLPDPRNFKILNCRNVGYMVVMEVQYPDCTSYEGRKILVYENVGTEVLMSSDRLDPHFCNHKGCISPIARFEPTKRGWEMALVFAMNWQR